MFIWHLYSLTVWSQVLITATYVVQHISLSWFGSCFSVFSGIWCYSPRMDRAQRLSAIWTISLSITDLIRPYMFNLQITWCCWADWVPASSRWTLIIWPHWRNLGHYASVLPMFCWSHFLISNTLYSKRWVTLAIAFLCKFIHLRG